MKEQIHSTREKILEAGKKEFLEKGFRDASLRTIVKEAGVTTGAFYGYYKSKEDLFDALVAEPYEKMMERYERAQVDFANLPPQEQSSHMGDISGQCIEWMTEYMYEEHDAFYLLLCCAVGTKYENFVHHMVEIEVEYTHRFMDALDSLFAWRDFRTDFSRKALAGGCVDGRAGTHRHFTLHSRSAPRYRKRLPFP